MNAKMKQAEQVLMRMLEELSQLLEAEPERGDARALALLMGLASVAKVVLGLKCGQLGWEKLLEKCPTFLTSASRPGMFRMKPIMAKRCVQLMDHQFSANPVYLTVHCYQCRDAVWGVNPQAYFCQSECASPGAPFPGIPADNAPNP